VKRQSAKGAKFEREFNAMKPLIHERSKGRCEAWVFALAWLLTNLPQGDNATALDVLGQVECGGYVTNTHHRKYRRRGGTNAYSNLIDLCLECHSWIHAHGGFGGPANLLGLALSSGESEAVPMWADGPMNQEKDQT
jgi:hypothetical protein